MGLIFGCSGSSGTVQCVRGEHDQRVASPTGTTSPRVPLLSRAAVGGTRWLEFGAALAVVVVMHAWTASDARAPIQTKDEIGYLLAGRLLAGAGGAELSAPDFAGGYGAGWGLLTIPLWWLGLAPDVMYPVAVALNVVFAAATLPLLVMLGRRLGGGPRTSLVAATVVLVAPGRALYSGYAMPEILISLLMAAVAVFGWDVVRGRAGPWGLGIFVASAGFLPTVHARMVPVTALAVLLLVWTAWRRAEVRNAVAAAVTVVMAAAGWLLNIQVERALYPGLDGRVAAAEDQVTALVPQTVALVAVGHAWYGAVAWMGLSVVGAVILLMRVAGPPRLVPTAAQADRSAGDVLADRVAGAWLLSLALIPWLVGAAYLSTRFGEGARLDMIVYGRYGDAGWGLLAVAGAVALLSGQVTRRAAAAAVAIGAAAAAGAWVAVLTLDVQSRGFVSSYVPGLAAWPWPGGDGLRIPLLPASIALMVALVAVFTVARSGPRARAVVVAAAGVALVVLSVVGEHQTLRPGQQSLARSYDLRSHVLAQQPATVVLVVDRPLLLSGNAYQFWLGDLPLRVVDPADGRVQVRPGEVVIAETSGGDAGFRAVDPKPDIAGALRLVATEPRGDYALWEVVG